MPPVFSVEEEKIAAFIRGVLPSWFWATERAQEELVALVKACDAARQRIDYFFRQGRILQADGPIADEPDWLNQHAIDRGTHRQASESNDALRLRLRSFEDAVTYPYLLELIGAMLAADGVVSVDYGIEEMPKDGAFWVTRQRIQGTASGTDAFAKSGNTMTLALAGVTFDGGSLYWGRPAEPLTITIAGATSGANNGDFPVTGFDGESIQWTNASGVAEVFAGTWTIGAREHDKPDFYWNRGYRWNSRRPAITAILPFGTSEALRLAIEEAMRQRKAAGVMLRVERREVP